MNKKKLVGIFCTTLTTPLFHLRLAADVSIIHRGVFLDYSFWEHSTSNLLVVHSFFASFTTSEAADRESEAPADARHDRFSAAAEPYAAYRDEHR